MENIKKLGLSPEAWQALSRGEKRNYVLIVNHKKIKAKDYINSLAAILPEIKNDQDKALDHHFYLSRQFKEKGPAGIEEYLAIIDNKLQEAKDQAIIEGQPKLKLVK